MLNFFNINNIYYSLILTYKFLSKKGILLKKCSDKIYFIKKNSINFFYLIKWHFNFLKNSLIDLTAIDFIEKNVFFCYYNFFSYYYNNRSLIYISINRNNDNNNIETISHIYKSANWLEREVWDMFGIFFKNHKDLRRILTDYGFKGHPLKKDFSLIGYFELRFFESYKSIKSYTIINNSEKIIFSRKYIITQTLQPNMI